MTKCLGLKWDRMSKTGGKRIISEEDHLRCLIRRRVWIAEYARALQLQEEGLAIVVSMDESYCHERQVSEFSYLPSDADGNPIVNVPACKGKGRRICIIGAVTKYGHVISHYPPGHPKAGQPIIDCAWIDNYNNHIESNGSFVELNNDGDPRRLYGRFPSCNKQMNKPTLQGITCHLRARKVNGTCWQ